MGLGLVRSGDVINRQALQPRPFPPGGARPAANAKQRGVLRFGAGFSLTDYVEANFRREAISRAYARFFARSGAAVLLTPTL